MNSSGALAIGINVGMIGLVDRALGAAAWQRSSTGVTVDGEQIHADEMSVSGN